MSATVSSLPPAAEGTCVRLTEGAALWAVKGATDWYRCDAEQDTCSCADWMFRRWRTVAPCKHLRALHAYLLAVVMVRAKFTAEAEIEAQRPPVMSDEELRRMFA
jgi:predicted nucleic acid-binding Zn finger protein